MDAVTFTLIASIYVGGGRHERLRVPDLNEALCRAWVAELVQTGSFARCEPTARICGDECRPLPGRRRV